MTQLRKNPYPNNFKDKNCLITGGLGFIGSNLAIHLIEQGAHVTIIDSLDPEMGGNWFNIEPIRDQVKTIAADLGSEKEVTPAIEQAEYIFNLAGQISHIDSIRRPLWDLANNCSAQLTFLENVRRTNPKVRVVFAATRQQYGKPKYLPVDENHPLDPTDINGIHKAAAEQYHLLYARVHGLWCSSLRLTNTYGPRMLLKHGRQGFIGVFLKLALEGERITLFGDGLQKRDYTFVRDVCDAFLQTALSGESGEAYNVGGYATHSHQEFAETLLKLTGNSSSIEKIPFPEEKKNIDIGDYFANDQKLKLKTGWKPRISLEEGLQMTLDFYRAHKGQYYGAE